VAEEGPHRPADEEAKLALGPYVAPSIGYAWTKGQDVACAILSVSFCFEPM
jgi:hypothetical protein